MYQYYCADCGTYGQAYADQDVAQRDGDSHQAETGHNGIQVHDSSSNEYTGNE
jgi:hypothetical protein